MIIIFAIISAWISGFFYGKLTSIQNKNKNKIDGGNDTI